MDTIFYTAFFIFILPYILASNEVMKVAKENSLGNAWSYFVISFLFSPITGLLFILARKNIIRPQTPTEEIL